MSEILHWVWLALKVALVIAFVLWFIALIVSFSNTVGNPITAMGDMRSIVSENVVLDWPWLADSYSGGAGAQGGFGAMKWLISVAGWYVAIVMARAGYVLFMRYADSAS